jgi:protein involved in polysaccharide export with SLBB domain
VPATARFVAPILLVFTLLVEASAAGAQALQSGFGVQPGDEIEVLVFTRAGEPLQAVMGTRYVDQDGRVYLPLVGSVQVRGLDPTGVRNALERQFSSFYDSPVVDVAVRFRVNITGAVRAPGHYYVVPGSTIQDAISIAGGAGSELEVGGFGGSDLENARLVRGDAVRIIDLRADAGAAADTREMVQSGDWIFVPNRPRARFRENLGLASSVVTLLASAVALVILVSQ